MHAYPRTIFLHKWCAKSLRQCCRLWVRPSPPAVVRTNPDGSANLPSIRVAERDAHSEFAEVAFDYVRIALERFGGHLAAGRNPVLGRQSQSAPRRRTSGNTFHLQVCKVRRLTACCNQPHQTNSTRGVCLVFNVSHRPSVNPGADART